MAYTVKRCPFCGGKTHVIDVLDDEENEKQAIQCTSCECQTALFDELSEAVDAWNMRV